MEKLLGPCGKNSLFCLKQNLKMEPFPSRCGVLPSRGRGRVSVKFRIFSSGAYFVLRNVYFGDE